MSTGNQVITYQYFSPARSETFNRIMYLTSFPGIIDGGALTKVDNSSVSIATLVAVIEDSSHTVGIRVETQDAVTLPVSNAEPYVVLRFTWQNTLSNQVNFVATDYAGLQADDLVLGKAVYSGATMSSTFDYSRKTISDLVDLRDSHSAFKVTTTEPLSTSAYVNAGVCLIERTPVVFAGGATSAFDFPVSSTGRIDLVTVNTSGSVVIVKGSEIIGTPIPDFPTNQMVVAKIIFPAGATQLLPEYINNYVFDRYYSVGLTEHIADSTNPHAVTKTQVGLGSVENYAIASQAEAVAGTSNLKYMTPLRTTELGDARYITPAGGTFTGTIILPTGSASTPSIGFTGYTDTGIYSPFTDVVGVTLSGVYRLGIFAKTSGVSLQPVQYSTDATAGANPAYSFSGDDDTGIARLNIDKLGLVTGGSARVTVDNSGRVGIGTTGPSKKLDISGDGINLEDTTTSSTGIIWKNGTRFIHNFQHPTGGTAIPDGYNTFIGEEAGNFTMGSTAVSSVQSSSNAGMGYYSLYSNTTGFNNSALGAFSLRGNTTGYRNTAIGNESLYTNTTGGDNTGVGVNSLLSNTSGNSNTGIGAYSLRSNTEGDFNTGMGYYSLYSNTTGNYNTGIGNSALYGNTTGSQNIGIGYEAGRFIANGSTANETSTNSIYLGDNTKANADGDTNEIVIGYEAIGQGSNSIVLGNDSITKTVLKGDVGIGTPTPSKKLDISGNGINLENTTTDATGIIWKNGTRFIHNFQHPTGDTAVPDGYNIFVGKSAGNFTMGSTATSVTHGSYNIGVGDQSLNSNTTGSHNTGIGAYSLSSNTTGDSNIGIGMYSLNSNTIGDNNIGIGYLSFFLNTTGSYNTGIGYSVLTDNTTGDKNTGIGYQSLHNNTTGSSNTAIGYYAGKFIDGSLSNETSSNSVYLGYDTRALADGDTNEIVIGYDATGVGSNSVVLGNDSIVKTVLKGKVGIGTTSPSHKLVVGDDIGSITSDNSIVIGKTGGTADAKLIIGDASNSYGMFNWDASANNLIFSTNNDGSINSNQLVLDSSGNVGIGTTSPIYLLSLGDTSSVISTDTSDTSDNKQLILAGGGDGSDSRAGYIYLRGNEFSSNAGDVNIGAGNVANAEITFSTGGNLRATIDSSGNVGIGTTEPTRKLSVVGDISTTGNIYTDSFKAYSTGSDFVFFDSANNELMRITDEGTTGNVGIGTSSPSGKLQIKQPTDTNTGGMIIEDVSGSNTGRLWMNGSTFRIQKGTVADGISISDVGNVGIGTTDPDNKLSFGYSSKIGWEYSSSDNNEYITIGTNSNGGNTPLNFKALWSSASQKIFSFYGAPSGAEAELFTILNDGNVGIGTPDPSYTLDVNGEINFANNSYLSANNNAGDGIVEILKVNTSDQVEFSSNVIFPDLTLTEDYSDSLINYGSLFAMGTTSDGTDGSADVDHGFIQYEFDGLTASNLSTVNLADWSGSGCSVTETATELIFTALGTGNPFIGIFGFDKNFTSGDKVWCSVRMRTNGGTASSISATIDGSSSGTNQDVDSQASPVDGTWYIISGLITIPADFTGGDIIKVNYVGVGSTERVLEIDKNYGVTTVNLTATFGSGNEPSEADCQKIFASYFASTKSVPAFGRVRSVGKNLDPEGWEQGNIGSGDGQNSPSTARLRIKGYIPLIADTAFYHKINQPTDGSVSLQFDDIFFYDSNFNFILVETNKANNGYTSTPPENARYFRYTFNQTGYGDFVLGDIGTPQVQLEYGTTATTYEPYDHQDLYYKSNSDFLSVPAITDRLVQIDGVYKHEHNVATGALGSELLINGDFFIDVEDDYWTEGVDGTSGNNWLIGSGVATHTAIAATGLPIILQQGGITGLTAGHFYRLQFDFSCTVSGRFRVVIGGDEIVDYTTFTTNGRKEYYFKSPATTSYIYFQASQASDTFTLDNVSLKEFSVANGDPLLDGSSYDYLESTYDDDTNLYYQLATPTYTIPEVSGSLPSYPKGSLIYDPYNREELAVSGTTITLSETAVSIERISLNGVTIDDSNYSLESDGVTVTFTGGVSSGDIIYAEYIMTFIMSPTSRTVFPENMKASTIENKKEITTQSKKLTDAVRRLDLLEHETVEHNGLYVKMGSVSIADDETILVPISTAGFGFIQVGDNEEFCQFCFSSTGVVTIIQNTTNIDDSDTDTKFCVFDNGSGIAIKNRLGSTKTLRYEIKYS